MLAADPMQQLSIFLEKKKLKIPIVNYWEKIKFESFN